MFDKDISTMDLSLVNCEQATLPAASSRVAFSAIKTSLFTLLRGSRKEFDQQVNRDLQGKSQQPSRRI
jgi:hypothetical protein